MFLVNEKYYQKLPDDLKKAFSEAAMEAAKAERQFLVDNEADDLAFLKSNGMIVTIPDVEKFREASKPVVSIMAEKVGWDIINLIKTYQE
jgi:TRAP-type C4-dicarboxylate transport system substrate-binding protein